MWLRSGVAVAGAQSSAGVPIQPLAWELLDAIGAAMIFRALPAAYGGSQDRG